MRSPLQADRTAAGQSLEATDRKADLGRLAIRVQPHGLLKKLDTL